MAIYRGFGQADAVDGRLAFVQLMYPYPPPTWGLRIINQPVSFCRWTKAGLALVYHLEPLNLMPIHLLSWAFHLNHKEGRLYRSSIPQWMLVVEKEVPGEPR